MCNVIKGDPLSTSNQIDIQVLSRAVVLNNNASSNYVPVSTTVFGSVCKLNFNFRIRGTGAYCISR